VLSGQFDVFCDGYTGNCAQFFSWNRWSAFLARQCLRRTGPWPPAQGWESAFCAAKPGAHQENGSNH